MSWKAVRAPKILIVEDEYLIGLDEQNRLASMGYSDVALVSSGELALERTRDQCPDLVLMNIGLAGKLDGVEAARMIRQRCRAAVVFVSAYSAERVGLDGRELFLRKPFTDADFRRMVELALE